MQSITDAAHELLALVEKESESWPHTASIEMDGDVLVVRSFTDPRGFVLLGKSYRTVSMAGGVTLSRQDTLRAIQAWITRETQAAVVAAGELVTL